MIKSYYECLWFFSSLKIFTKTMKKKPFFTWNNHLFIVFFFNYFFANYIFDFVGQLNLKLFEKNKQTTKLNQDFDHKLFLLKSLRPFTITMNHFWDNVGPKKCPEIEVFESTPVTTRLFQNGDGSSCSRPWHLFGHHFELDWHPLGYLGDNVGI